jgi:asparagine synthase (glutamine-hydrolysing)
MCGIAGYFNSRDGGLADPAVVDAMCRALTHRGPDDQGILTDGKLGFGMRRLSIIDLSTGHQPIANESKSVWVVFNGEIYNYRDLAKWLIDRGHHLSTSSDTEVIVHLYEELGPECVHKLRGMFAFALWDRDHDRVFIARDRLGVKPLYYFWDERRLVFGSELKAVLAHPDVRCELDYSAILYYLRYGYIPDPLTPFEHIAKLPPGHVMTVTAGTLSVAQYWDGARPGSNGAITPSEQASVEQLQTLLDEAVSLRLISDVPLGAFLSGGIDSSLVVAVMARHMGQPVKTFSIGFEEAAYNELPHAGRVARHIGTDHHELMVGPQECGLIEELVRHFDEPFGDPSSIPTYCLSKLTAQYVKVALSGDAGDELFAGYDRYRMDLDRHRLALPNEVKRLLGIASDLLPEGFYGRRWMRSLALPAPARYLENISHTAPLGLMRIVSDEFRGHLQGDQQAERLMTRYFDRVADTSWLAQLQYFDTKTYLPADVLTKVDRMSMAHSLEVRGPFLDHVLVEYVSRLPAKMKFRDGISKYLLKQVASRYLPSEIVHRKKQGFGVPLEYWFKGESLKGYVRDILFDSRSRARGLLRHSEVERLVVRYERGCHELATLIWMLAVLETWCRLYVDQDHSHHRLEPPCIQGARSL